MKRRINMEIVVEAVVTKVNDMCKIIGCGIHARS